MNGSSSFKFLGKNLSRWIDGERHSCGNYEIVFLVKLLTNRHLIDCDVTKSISLLL